jgi:hypothetical protein
MIIFGSLGAANKRGLDGAGVWMHAVYVVDFLIEESISRNQCKDIVHTFSYATDLDYGTRETKFIVGRRIRKLRHVRIDLAVVA